MLNVNIILYSIYLFPWRPPELGYANICFWCVCSNSVWCMPCDINLSNFYNAMEIYHWNCENSSVWIYMSSEISVKHALKKVSNFEKVKSRKTLMSREEGSAPVVLRAMVLILVVVAPRKLQQWIPYLLINMQYNRYIKCILISLTLCASTTYVVF